MKKESLAEYNNNPGNIRPGKLKYEGMIGVDDQGFAVFATPAAGRAALQQDVSVKLNRSMSARQFVDQYAPAGDNTEEARDNYVLSIMSALNLSSSADKIEATDENIQKVMSVIGRVESGKPPADQASETSMTEQLAGQGIDVAAQAIDSLGRWVAENPNSAIGIGTGALANKLFGNPIGAIGEKAYQGAKSGIQTLAQRAAPIMSDISTSAKYGSEIAKTGASNIGRSAVNFPTIGKAAGLATRAAPFLGAAALPVMGLTAGLGVPAYMMYQNYAKMTPLERQQRLEEAQQAGLPGP